MVRLLFTMMLPVLLVYGTPIIVTYLYFSLIFENIWTGFRKT